MWRLAAKDLRPPAQPLERLAEVFLRQKFCCNQMNQCLLRAEQCREFYKLYLLRYLRDLFPQILFYPYNLHMVRVLAEQSPEFLPPQKEPIGRVQFYSPPTKIHNAEAFQKSFPRKDPEAVQRPLVFLQN